MLKKNSKRTAQSPSAIHKFALVLFGLLVAVLLLLLSEAVLAVFGVRPPDRYRDPFLGFEEGVDLFERGRDSDGNEVWRTRETKLSFFNEQRFSALKPKLGFRVFALGGSTTFGRPYDWQMAFPHWLKLLLEDMNAETRYEVVNAGGVSYASYRLVILMKELVRYQPDLFVIYTGHNEFLEERTYPELKREGGLTRRIKTGMNRLRTVTLMRRALRPESSDRTLTGMSSEVRARLDVWSGLDSYHRDDDLRRDVLRHFEHNIGRMIDIARDHGVPILFVSPASNLKDFSPFKSEHGAAFDASRQAAFKNLYESGVNGLRDGNPSAALDALQRALAMDGQYADLHYRMGRAFFALGDADRARFHFERALALDVCPLRAPHEVSAILKRVTESRGAPLIDLPGILQADLRVSKGHDILGEESFLDHVHPTVAVHQRIAEEVLLEAMNRNWTGFQAPLPPDREARIYQPVVASRDAAYLARRDLNLAKVLGWAGKVEEAARVLERSGQELEGDAEFHFNLGVVFERLNRPEEALQQYFKTVVSAPEHFEAFFNAGKVLQKLEAPDRALAAFQEALALRPGHGETLFNSGLCYRHLEQPERALEQFRLASEADPPFPTARRYLALTYRDMGRWEEALQEARALAEAESENASPWFDLGVIYGRSGRFEEAASAFEKVLALEPEDVDALRNLASAYQSAGQESQALGALKRVAALRPLEARAHFELGAYQHRLKRWEQAERAYLEAIRLEPTHSRALANLGAAYAATGRVEEGIATLEKALAGEPSAGDIHYNLAQLYLVRGKTSLAVEHLKNARQLGVRIAPELEAFLQTETP